MVINSTNINKTKESLNNDGHQFYQYSFFFLILKHFNLLLKVQYFVISMILIFLNTCTSNRGDLDVLKCTCNWVIFKQFCDHSCNNNFKIHMYYYRLVHWLLSLIEHICIGTTSILTEWVSDCCLTPTQQFFSNIMTRTS